VSGKFLTLSGNWRETEAHFVKFEGGPFRLIIMPKLNLFPTTSKSFCDSNIAEILKSYLEKVAIHVVHVRVKRWQAFQRTLQGAFTLFLYFIISCQIKSIPINPLLHITLITLNLEDEDCLCLCESYVWWQQPWDGDLNLAGARSTNDNLS